MITPGIDHIALTVPDLDGELSTDPATKDEAVAMVQKAVAAIKA